MRATRADGQSSRSTGSRFTQSRFIRGSDHLNVETVRYSSTLSTLMTVLVIKARKGLLRRGRSGGGGGSCRVVTAGGGCWPPASILQMLFTNCDLHDAARVQPDLGGSLPIGIDQPKIKACDPSLQNVIRLVHVLGFASEVTKRLLDDLHRLLR
jgi:hypothetical protein